MSDTYKFKAEINQLMNLIINAFYSNKDIFLRELISNSSDAIDKVRHDNLKSGNSGTGIDNFTIKLSYDKENGMIEITDNGIGMTKQDLMNNLGMIANSGTKAFMERLQETNDMNLIGQFGVGFYSAFLVADHVQVITKNDKSGYYIWESDADGTYTIRDYENKEPEFKRGTRIILNIKTEETKYLDDFKLRDIIKKHSEFISYPIQLRVTEYEEVEISEDEDEEKSDGNEEKDEQLDEDVKIDDVKNSDSDSDSDDDRVKKTKRVEKHKWETINRDQPIWHKNPSEVTDEEYQIFYKTVTNDYDNYLTKKHFAVEGAMEFRGIIFIPTHTPNDMFEPNKKPRNIKLYVRKIFITDDCEELVPEWMSFIKGMIDSNDLPLNVSREMMQQNRIIRVMRKNLVRKTIEMIQDLADENKDSYMKFYHNFSKNIKLGIHADNDNRDKLGSLLRYHSMKHTDKMISLQEYVSEMTEGQKYIYYIPGESREAVENSIFLEGLREQGYDVLFMTEPIDEYLLQKFNEYEKYPFTCVTKENLDICNIEELSKDANNKELCKWVSEVIGDRVSTVRISNRLVHTPCCIVTGLLGYTANMERIMKAQALTNAQSDAMSGAKNRFFELNPNHSLIQSLRDMHSDGGDGGGGDDNKKFRETVLVMFNMALLQSGFTIADSNEFSETVYKLLSN
jgi:molecular chaperone HtpG